MELEEKNEDIKFVASREYSYRWEEWIKLSLDAPDKVLTFKRGEDYGVETPAFGAGVHQAAKRNGLKAKTASSSPDSLTVRFYKPER